MNMRPANEIYGNVMYELLRLVQRRQLEKIGKIPDIQNFESTTEPGNLVHALIETGHEALVSVVFTGQDATPHNFRDALWSHLKLGNIQKAVDLYGAHPKHISIEGLQTLSRIVAAPSVPDATVLDFVDISTAAQMPLAHIYNLLTCLKNYQRDDLTETVIEVAFEQAEKPLVRLQKRIEAGEEITVEDVKESTKFLHEVKPESSHTARAVFKKLLEVCNRISAPFEVQLALCDEYQALHHEGKVSYIQEVHEVTAEIFNIYINQEEFDKAEAMLDAKKDYRARQLARARINYAVKTGDQELHASQLPIELAFQEREINEFSTGHEEWQRRLDYYGRKSLHLAEILIFELAHCNEKKAQKVFDQMVGWLDKMLVSPNPGEEPTERDLKAYKNFRKKYKRLIRRRFFEVGVLEKLPKYEGWSDMMMSEEEKYEMRQSKIEKRSNGISLFSWTEKNAKLNQEDHTKFRQNLPAMIREEGVEFALTEIRLLSRYEKGELVWDSATELLKLAPCAFQEILEILKPSLPHLMYSDVRKTPPFKAMVHFYLVGHELGAATKEDLQVFIKEFYGDRFDNSHIKWLASSLPTAVVVCHLERGLYKEAHEYFWQMAGMINLEPETVSICFAKFIEHAQEQINSPEEEGMHQAFTGKPLPASAPKVQKVAYWNSEVERLALTAGEAFEQAQSKLLELLNDPSSISFTIGLLARGSLRTKHQKKDILMHGYKNAEDYHMKLQIVEALIDNKIPGAEAMPEVKSKKTPDEVTIRFFEKLANNRVLHTCTKTYLTPEHLPYLRSLLSQYQNEFNTVIDCIAMASNCDVHREWPGIFKTLKIMGTLTPGIYTHAKRCNYDEAALRALKTEFDAAKPKMFKNIPLVGENISDEVVAELVYIAYKPANMSHGDVLRLCKRVKDLTHHLDRFKFPQDGYDLDLYPKQKMKLKSASDKLETLPILKELQGKGHSVTNLARALCNFGRLKFKGRSLVDFFDLFNDDQTFISPIVNVLYNDEDHTENFNNLMVLQEIIGIYLEDNLEDTIHKFFEEYYESLSKMLASFCKSIKQHSGRRRAIEQQLGLKIDKEKPDIRFAAEIIAHAILKKFQPLQDFRGTVAKDLSKFITEDSGEEIEKRRKIKAIISKNKGSFFAKGSAGICTARDTELFEREDHFHLNLVDEEAEQCVGNVQCYIMEQNGKEYLLLRGINPNNKLLKDVDTKNLTESIINIGRQFAAENGLEGVLISEQAGNFLALSNRGSITEHIQKTYRKNLKQIIPFKITRNMTISRVYDIDGTLAQPAIS